MPLTTAEEMEHIGRMFMRLLQSDFAVGEDKLLLKDAPSWAKSWRENGGLGTVADRSEAMKTFMRQLHTSQTGNDPDGGAAAEHAHLHALDNYPGERIHYE